MNEWPSSNKISFFIISDKSCHVAQVVCFIPIVGIIYVYSLNLLCVPLKDPPLDKQIHPALLL